MKSIFLSWLLCVSAAAQTVHHASPTSMPSMEPGDMVILETGRYRQTGPVYLTVPRVRLIAERKWATILYDSPSHGYIIAAEGIELDGVEISGAQGTGIKLVNRPADVTLRNVWVHHCQTNGIEAGDVDRLTLQDSILCYNGNDPQFEHGLYASGRDHRIIGNRIYANANTGLQLYGKAKCSGFLVVDNVLWSISDRQQRNLLLQAGETTRPSLVARNRAENAKRGYVFWGGDPSRPNVVTLNNGPILDTDSSGKKAATTQVANED